VLGLVGRVATHMPKVLIVTNDFPPRSGGIQSFVHALAVRLPAGQVVVYAPAWKGAAEFDARQPFPVIRHRTSLMLPVPAVARRARAILTEHGCDTVLFGAAAPLGLLAPGLRRAGARRIVALTHGHEAGWAALPGARALLRRIGEHVDVLTYLGEYCRIRLARALTPGAARRMVRLAPGVDNESFRPGAGGAAIRERFGIPPQAAVVLCVSRMVPRKGQDTLITVWPKVLAGLAGRPVQAQPPVLLLVGDGPSARALHALARREQVSDSVIFAGPVPWEDLPAYYDAGTIFAMPCRTRRGGLDVEGLGIVYLEASATGLPVVSGDSGGAPDAVLPGETGYVVGGRDKDALADRLISLLGDPQGAETMGEKGLAWVDREWRWDIVAARLREILAPPAS
jgi:phosphatidylinositol alpha-1,6-mannosyltransferase